MTNRSKPARTRKPTARGIEASKTQAGQSETSNAATGETENSKAVTSKAATGDAEDRDTEACNTAALLTEARAALEQFIDIKIDDDGALSFQHGGVPGAVQAVQLAEGLVMLSLTCVVAWDVPASDDDLAVRLAMRAGDGLFGTLGVVRTQAGYDVTLRYAFPAAGLEPTALGTLMMLVISTASQLRSELLPT